jgi:hypothetical protein
MESGRTSSASCSPSAALASARPRRGLLEEVVARREKNVACLPDRHAVLAPGEIGDPAVPVVHPVGIEAREPAARTRIAPPDSSSIAGSSSQRATAGVRPARPGRLPRPLSRRPAQGSPAAVQPPGRWRRHRGGRRAPPLTAPPTSRGSSWAWRNTRDSPADWPEPGAPLSYTATDAPCSSRAWAVESPTMPAPTTRRRLPPPTISR